jgi:peptidoglycan/xylan/chitin deacetylase (PgdA/CDA1 family)
MKFIFLSAFVFIVTAISSNAIGQEMFQIPFTEATTATTSKKEREGITKVKKATVVLTYDDALHVHLDHALPLLDSLGLKATFYVSGYTNALQTRLQQWRAAAQNGHELGNHTLFHPCTGGMPGREFVKKEYDLSTYSISRIEDEIKMTNTLLQALDRKTKRTFAYPCNDTKIGTEYYLKNLEPQFTGARAVYTETPELKNAQLYNLGSYLVNGQTGEELIAMVKKAVEKEGLLVFLFHGVGGEHSLNVSLDAHRQLLRYLKQHQDEIWIAPMTEVAEQIKALQSGAVQKK